MDNPSPLPDGSAPPASGGSTQPVVREFELSELMHGSKEIRIRHGGEIYRLRLTKNDKLILQK